MPLIRYKQDDHVLASKTSKCRCGSNFRIIENIMGRLNDCFILSSGKILPSGFLLDLMYTFLLDNDDEIYDYCIVQEAPNHIIIEIIPGINFRQSTLDNLQDRFKKQINENLKIETRSVNRLRKTLSGKKNPIICAIERNKQ